MFLLMFYKLLLKISTIVQWAFMKILLQDAIAKKLEFVLNRITFSREEKLR